MRTLLSMTALLAILCLAACKTSESSITEGTAGPAYNQIDNIDRLFVLPAELPDEIHGNASDAEKERFRQDWPMAAARQIASGVTSKTGKRTVASVAEEAPDHDYYFEIEITYVDVGDPKVRAGDVLGNDQEGWSLVTATGRIINGSTGEVVAKLSFNESSGWAKSTVPFENDMANLGEELGAWIEARR